MRMIVVFQKSLALRHIGHLDLMRTIQRALRRTDLPIQYSHGFNPHIQLSFAAPLSVGVIGERELMDVPMASDVDELTFASKLNTVLPSTLHIIRARKVDDRFPTLMALVAGSKMRIDIDAGADADRIPAALARFMALEECITLRKTKSGQRMTNVRPFIKEASIEPTADGYTLKCIINNRQEGSLKPSVLMQALYELDSIPPVSYIASRECILANQNGTLIPLEDYTHD